MFPIIFALAIKDLVSHTGQGSSLLVMAIVGGAIFPPVLGLVADITGIQLSLLVPLVCHVHIAYYRFEGYKPSLMKDGLHCSLCPHNNHKSK